MDRHRSDETPLLMYAHTAHGVRYTCLSTAYPQAYPQCLCPTLSLTLGVVHIPNAHNIASGMHARERAGGYESPTGAAQLSGSGTAAATGMRAVLLSSGCCRESNRYALV